MKVHFTKMHGAGNDYIYVDTSLYPVPDPAAAARAWSRPHTGVGSDGLVLIEPAPGPEADFGMRIFNADGSEGRMCGNACRCIGKYLYERGLTRKRQIRLATLSGVVELCLRTDAAGRVTSVTADMGLPAFSDPALLAVPSLVDETLPGTSRRGTFVSMGNPHCVLFVDDAEAVDLAQEGPELERHLLFPQRCNIEFAEVRPDGIRARVWERGSGRTLACGSGACAVAVAAARTGRAPRRSAVRMDGGTLEVDWNADSGHVYLSGPAAYVFDGDIEL
ncbi:MAG: diaminopimelate epimerase [Bacteroidales bacterium]|nr:diaminopimelate epimerase [Bacteroidales bacterium]